MAANAAPTTKPQAGFGPFEVFRRAKNVKNASLEERRAILESAERYEGWSLVSVIAGVVLEAILFVTPISNQCLRVGEFVADMLVGLGIWVEFRYGSVSGSVLKTNLAEAEEQLVKLAWRNLDDIQAKLLRDGLEQLPVGTVQFWIWADAESAYFVRNWLRKAFDSLSWNVRVVTSTYAQDAGFGIWIADLPVVPSPVNREFSKDVQEVFSSSGVDFHSISKLPQPAVQSADGPYAAEPLVDIYVGPKRPIEID
jgi:hypothetical protein